MEKIAQSSLIKSVDQYLVDLLEKSDNDELSYLRSFIDLADKETAVINGEYFSNGEKNMFEAHNIISIDSLNDISQINDFISNINAALPEGGKMACKFYPDEARVEAIQQKRKNRTGFYLAYIKDYFKNKVRSLVNKSEGKKKLPLAEALGRVSAGGFEILDYKQFGECIYLIAEKVSEPSFGASESNGIIFKMKRIGKDGATNVFYKFRTMHLYAEYLQNFVYQKNGLENGDKFINDFRITKFGNFLRKYWLDELPMLVNLFKGDLKLVGVRPLSNHKFSLYNKTLQEYRTKFKPGLIPPFYADMPDSLEGLMDSEMRYLQAYDKQPLKTDVKYFFKTLYNILIKGARSK